MGSESNEYPSKSLLIRGCGQVANCIRLEKFNFARQPALLFVKKKLVASFHLYIFIVGRITPWDEGSRFRGGYIWYHLIWGLILYHKSLHMSEFIMMCFWVLLWNVLFTIFPHPMLLYSLLNDYCHLELQIQAWAGFMMSQIDNQIITNMNYIQMADATWHKNKNVKKFALLQERLWIES